MVKWKIFIFDPFLFQIALLRSLHHGNSKIVARFDIGWAVLICIRNLQTYRQTDGQTHSSHYNIDIKGSVEVKNLHFWSNSFANSFVKSILKWEFQICAYMWYQGNGFDFYLDVTYLTLTLTPNLSKVTLKQKIFIFDPIFLQMALLPSLYHGNSKLVARFGIGWAVLICIGNLRTYRQTDGQTHCSNYNIDTSTEL